MRVGAIDIGTNSTLLLVAERVEFEVVAVHEAVQITRLGAGVDKTGRLDPAALDRTLSYLRELGTIAHELGVEQLEAVATSAARDASNGAELLDGCEEAVGVRPRVIGGEEEARLSFEGALSGLPPRPALVVDIGGGSTELVVGAKGSTPSFARSADIGAVRLTERHLRLDPPTQSELLEAGAAIDAAIPWIDAVPLDDVQQIVGVAGTFASLATVQAAETNPVHIHGYPLSLVELRGLTQRLARHTRAQRAALVGLDPKRADVIVAGALIATRVVEHAQRRRPDLAGVTMSARGLRWGLAARMLGLVAC
jgi:exopolyphosphatase/guanosine-5'-triphosphate,3'-diphosphate pyrophosphatase